MGEKFPKEVRMYVRQSIGRYVLVAFTPHKGREFRSAIVMMRYFPSFDAALDFRNEHTNY